MSIFGDKALGRERVERRLAAILAADVAGYSRLMGEDETGTLARLGSHRRELVDPKVAEHKGRIVKTTGDGILIEFPSVVEAVACAVELQRGMAERNAATPAQQRIVFRVGINLGDVIVEDGDIYGDGVNVAARLEALAEPGGVCISGVVWDQIDGKLPYSFIDLGAQTLKNIARPVRSYSFDPIAVAATALRPVPGRQPLQKRRTPARRTGNKKVPPRLSIVVLPFANLSSDPEQEYFVDGITDDLTTDLSRIEGSFVIARTTAFTYKGKAVDVKQIGRELAVRYLLEGSVRRVGDRVQANVQLIDTENGAHVWADRFDTDRRDLGEAQSEITRRLARTLGFEIVRDAARTIERHIADPNAADLTLQGRALLSRPTSMENYTKALSIFERALELEPHLLEARFGIARTLANGPEGTGPVNEEARTRAEHLLRDVMERDPNLSEAHRVLGTLLSRDGRWSDAMAAMRTAASLDPNNAAALRNYGQLLHSTGRYEAAIPHIEKALRLSPRDPGVAFGYNNLGLCYLFLGRLDEAMDLFIKAAAANPRIYYIHFTLAGALGLRGDRDAAKAEIAEAVKLKPEIRSVSHWREYLRSIGLGHPEWLAAMDRTVFKGLRDAGFPAE